MVTLLCCSTLPWSGKVELEGSIMANPVPKMLLDCTQPAQMFLPVQPDGMTTAELLIDCQSCNRNKFCMRALWNLCSEVEKYKNPHIVRQECSKQQPLLGRNLSHFSKCCQYQWGRQNWKGGRQ